METEKKKTFRLERTYDASPEALWAAWTDAKQFARWFNPFPGRDAEIVTWEVRVGGRIAFRMVGPDGTKYPNEGTFLALDPYRELVTGEADGMKMRVTFHREGARTRMVIDQTGLAAEVDLDQARGGWGVILDRLGDHAKDALDRTIVLSRVIDAPPGRVFDAWTDARQLDRWFGPAGFTTVTHAMDARRGGTWRYTMTGPDGTKWENLVQYEIMDRPRLLGYVHGSPDEPDQFRVTVTFEDEGGRTRLTSRMLLPSRAALEEARKFGAEELGHETFEKLAEHLAS